MKINACPVILRNGSKQNTEAAKREAKRGGQRSRRRDRNASNNKSKAIKLINERLQPTGQFSTTCDNYCFFFFSSATTLCMATQVLSWHRFLSAG